MTCAKCLFAAISILAVAGCDRGVTIGVSADQLQPAVEAYFPVQSKDYVEHTLPVEVTLSEPLLILTEGSDRLGLQVTVIASAESESEPSVISDDATIGPPGGSLPFAPPETQSALPGKVQGSVVASGKIDYRSQEGAFYLLEPEIDEVTFEDLPPADVGPLKTVVEEVLKKYFAENPVYTLSDKDMKMKAAKLLLKSVVVKGRILEITLGA